MASSARIDELKKKFDENPRRYFAPLANEYRKVGDLDQALFICEAYLPQQPGHMSGHIVHGQTLFEMGRFDDSKAAFGSALALDPENLIALRHLGDIAKQAGDLNTAREWYQRVLEADPRNEEIVEVMAELRRTTQGGAAPSSPTYRPSSTQPAAAVPSPPVSAPPPPPPPAPRMPTPVASAPVPAAPVDDTPDDDLLDLDSMMIGETPLSTPAVSSAPPAATDDDAAFESDPLAIAANEPPVAEPPAIELATDINLGLVDDGTQSDVAPPADAPTLEGLRSYEAGTLPEKDQIVDSSLEMEPFYDILHGEAAPAEEPEAQSSSAVSLHSDAPAESVSSEAKETLDELLPSADFSPYAETPAIPSPAVRVPTPTAPEAFITETMAELYLQQGHLDSALDIYRKLLQQRPDDPALIERVRSVEARAYGTPEPTPADEQESIDTAIAAPESGPTIREFLVSLLGSSGSGSNGNGPSEGTLSRHTLPGSIDAMFADAGSSTSDSTAASALGTAFGMEAFEEIGGEGSNQVLSGTPPTSQAAEGFSFDQFFAGDSSVAPPKPSSETGAPPVESPEDVAQFNAWLNGLKKT